MTAKNIRLAGAIFVAAVAIGCVASASASAELQNPLFIPGSGVTVTGVGGASKLRSADLEIECKENHIVSGEIATSLLIGNIVINYLGCTVPKGEEISGCTAKSTNTTHEGLILTNTLHAILGIELPANKNVLVILPLGSAFTTIASETTKGKLCIPESRVTGTVAGLIRPESEKTTKGTFTTESEVRGVRLTHDLGSVTAKLVAFGITSILIETDSLTFSGMGVEVT